MTSTDTLTLHHVAYDCQHRIGCITLNRPEKRNALDSQLVVELRQAFEYAEEDEACKVIVLRAAGPVFCAGADLTYLQQLQPSSFQANLEDSTLLMQLFHQIYTLKKVVIAQVQGAAIGSGCGLASVCDFAYTVPSARFGYPEVKIGFLPAIVKVFLLRKIGEAKTRELLLTGDLISAEKARETGLVNEVVPEQDLAQRVSELAQRLCIQNSGQAMESIKEMIAHVQELPLRDALEYATERSALMRATHEWERGVSALLNKEPVQW